MDVDTYMKTQNLRNSWSNYNGIMEHRRAYPEGTIQEKVFSNIPKVDSEGINCKALGEIIHEYSITNARYKLVSGCKIIIGILFIGVCMCGTFIYLYKLAAIYLISHKIDTPIIESSSESDNLYIYI